MKKINNTAIRSTLTEEVNKMTVAEMRQAAKCLGIKNAKKYKRDVLSGMVIDAMYENKMAQSKTAKKSAEGSNLNIEVDVAKVEAVLETATRQYAVEALMAYGRQVLIRVMKSYHVKGWYRIYDKPTMVSCIVEAACVG
jgi:hypothetical protein|nr:MAG TPA: Rho termination factor, N-terminal domain [Caudoviricetes sp.]